jgi:hypothetical protein
MSFRSMSRLGAVAALVLAGALAGGARAQDPPLNKNLDQYFVFAMRHSHLKNMKMTVRGCNVGVNCRHPSEHSECGVILHDDPFYADNSQIQGCVARFSKPGGSIWQLFRNDTSPLDNVTIRHPGIKPDGSNPCDTPILGDVDHDGQPSCETVAQACVPDYGDLETFCHFPTSFPACDPTKGVRAKVQADCTGDALPGNQACDLAPGVYGTLTVDNAATVNLVGTGDYVFCNVVAGKSVKIFGPGATILVPDGGQFKVNNGSVVGLDCGEIRLFQKGAGVVRFGRNSSINMRVCAPEANVQLGHANKLNGNFFGDYVDSDLDNEGGCCPGLCSCFDKFDPPTATGGAEVTMESHCNLMPVTEVHVCGVTATIISQTSSKIVFQVPNGLSGQSCDVEALSPAGVFKHVDKLVVS